ncbi:MAG TPA: translesion error-prone DNA polymerase V autoproteolytic subunit [Gammaproteobacteria bacterium]|jgi:DNA polymerase V|uniref:Peptidase S24/S26A/S26B/S26C domain-containing protein n=1 Tax=marine metagenome TaxID=408172 RepID=A0A381R8J3_9ZZZZ|nr:translesion error-prone DNA polymerase V autoproteolytic subunit [SAR86 cluster bacterium]HIA43393.1 translesion error-prone DNA polymerase V autoproteolytic subunit [Gammaproteobacteria bacterium]HIG50129.1 translesion error-prone DNA polymerase V autoproteolytic subunit [Gammaproteobacteria bacterium]|tara:strand:- start:363 stop:791 length:429 start_codon:yes stop_codon:yes gene_type:complete
MVVKYLGDTSEGDFPLIEIPYFLNRVRVGWPSPADDYVERPIDLNEYLIKNPAATYFVRVSGDSMIDAYIGDGAILVVDRSVEPKHKSIVVAAINGSYACKRLLTKPKVCLASENSKYAPIFIKENEELEIAGVVIAAINTY